MSFRDSPYHDSGGRSAYVQASSPPSRAGMRSRGLAGPPPYASSASPRSILKGASPELPALQLEQPEQYGRGRAPSTPTSARSVRWDEELEKPPTPHGSRSARMPRSPPYGHSLPPTRGRDSYQPPQDDEYGEPVYERFASQEQRYGGGPPPPRRAHSMNGARGRGGSGRGPPRRAHSMAPPMHAPPAELYDTRGRDEFERELMSREYKRELHERRKEERRELRKQYYGVAYDDEDADESGYEDRPPEPDAPARSIGKIQNRAKTKAQREAERLRERRAKTLRKEELSRVRRLEQMARDEEKRMYELERKRLELQRARERRIEAAEKRRSKQMGDSTYGSLRKKTAGEAERVLFSRGGEDDEYGSRRYTGVGALMRRNQEKEAARGARAAAAGGGEKTVDDVLKEEADDFLDMIRTDYGSAFDDEGNAPATRIIENTTGRKSIAESLGLKKPERVTVLVLGEDGSGKSSLLFRYALGLFPVEPHPADREDVGRAEVVVDATRAVVSVQDTANLNDQSHVRQDMLNEADGFVFVYDITSSQSLNWVRELIMNIQTVYKQMGGHRKIAQTPMFMVANKIDLLWRPHEQSLMAQEESLVAKWCKQRDLAYFEVSAKSGRNVEHLWDEVTKVAVRAKRLALKKAQEKRRLQEETIKAARKKEGCTIM